MVIPPGSVRVDAPAAAAVIPWYLAGGISAANCLAAYEPKGAADYAASKVNIVNPGTYNAAKQTNDPGWDAANGWMFAANNDALKTGLAIADAWSWIVQFTNVPAGASQNIAMAGGSTAAANPKFISPNYFNYAHFTYKDSGGTWREYKGTAYLSGTQSFAGFRCFINGVYKQELNTTGLGGTLTNLGLGGVFNASLTFYKQFSGYIQRAAIYDTTITDVQMAAVHAALAAL